MMIHNSMFITSVCGASKVVVASMHLCQFTLIDDFLTLLCKFTYALKNGASCIAKSLTFIFDAGFNTMYIYIKVFNFLKRQIN